ncbi:MAG: ATP-binding protein [Candidatus Rokubacteria bacterium]|nr:ATP-binding protein [Candidatus Rokubacteria bacterium]
MRAETLVITSESRELARVRAWLGEQLARRGLDSHAQSALQVAVGELTTNSIKHAYEGRAGEPIHISVESREDSVVIQVEDFGKPFDPSRYRHPDLDEMNESGVGLYIVKRLADELTYDLARERGTRWTLVKYQAGTRPRSA